MTNLMLIAILFPIFAGVLLLVLPIKEEKRNIIVAWTAVSLAISLVLIALSAFLVPEQSAELVRFNDTLIISFKPDSLGRLFSLIMGIVWVCAGFYSFEYMKHEKKNKRYFGVFLLVLGVLIALCYAENLVTYYTFYEFMTIGSFALVLHNQSREAIMAGLKYLFYSFAGAYMVLFGLYFVHQYSVDPAMTFMQGGIIDTFKAATAGALTLAGTAAGKGILGISMLLMILGFSVKAGMFPMHGWLPTAHPVAPAPASAALSAIIVKGGVLGVIRVIYYVFGSELFSGSYVQTVVLILSLTTVFIGSMLAYKEKVFKKRLAYSTVSQVSYILFGLFIVNTTAFEGSILHVAAHAAIKSTLFMVAGAIIYKTGCTRVGQLRGIGRKMPVLMWCYTIVSLGLIGIPPFGGFTSKWFLCVGSLTSGVPVFDWLGPVILLVSALLTAGYLLPITINAFLPGADFEKEALAVSDAGNDSPDGEYHAYLTAKEPKLIMLVPILILTLASVVLGLFPEVLSWV
ncbi:MAG: proton-conducting membrane transporter [Lachnospiraceae bacterium]|nr:proton-conducting membrane transporter [Candidatus Merdinaster equi]